MRNCRAGRCSRSGARRTAAPPGPGRGCRTGVGAVGRGRRSSASISAPGIGQNGAYAFERTIVGSSGLSVRLWRRLSGVTGCRRQARPRPPPDAERDRVLSSEDMPEKYSRWRVVVGDRRGLRRRRWPAGMVGSGLTEVPGKRRNRLAPRAGDRVNRVTIAAESVDWLRHLLDDPVLADPRPPGHRRGRRLADSRERLVGSARSAPARARTPGPDAPRRRGSGDGRSRGAVVDPVTLRTGRDHPAAHPGPADAAAGECRRDRAGRVAGLARCGAERRPRSPARCRRTTTSGRTTWCSPPAVRRDRWASRPPPRPAW